MATLNAMKKTADKIVKDIKALPDTAPVKATKEMPVKATKIIGANNPLIAAALERDVPQSKVALIKSVVANVDAEHDAGDRIVRAKYDTFVDILRACANGVDPDGMKDVARAFIIRQGERTGKEFQKDEKTGEIIVNKLYLNQVASRFNTAGGIAYGQDIDVPYVLNLAFDYKTAWDKAAKEFTAANKGATVKMLSQEDSLNNVCTLIKAAQGKGEKAAATPKLKSKLVEEIAGDVKTKVEKKPEVKVDVLGDCKAVYEHLKAFQSDNEELVTAMNNTNSWLVDVITLLEAAKPSKPVKAK